jgi:hypothetical protein
MNNVSVTWNQTFLVSSPLVLLTDDERAAVEDDENAVERLIDLLADVPTPAGPTRRELEQAPDRAPDEPANESR